MIYRVMEGGLRKVWRLRIPMSEITRRTFFTKTSSSQEGTRR